MHPFQCLLHQINTSQMKTAYLIFSITLFIGSNAYSQDEEIELKKFGVGVSHAFNYSEFWITDYPMDLNKILFTVNLNNKFRIEPEISGGYNKDYDEYWVYAGSGFFFQKQKNKLNTLYGLRTAASYTDYAKLTLHVAPAVGMEYFFSSQFSVGAEFQLIAGFNISDPDEKTLAILVPFAARFYLK